MAKPAHSLGGQEVKLDGEYLNQDYSQPEGGKRLPQHRHQLGAGVNNGSLLDSGDNPQRYGGDQYEHYGRPGQLDRGHNAFNYLVLDWRAASYRAPKVALQEVPHEYPILNYDVAVKTEGLADFQPLFLGVLLVDKQICGVAGQPDNPEHNDRQQKQGNYGLPRSPQDVLLHCFLA